MSELKEITLNKKFIKGKGSFKKIDNFKNIYSDDLIKNKSIKKLKPLLHAVTEQLEFLHLKF